MENDDLQWNGSEQGHRMGNYRDLWHCYGLMCKNGEEYVVDFACAKSCHHFICGKLLSLPNLTDMHWKPSAGFSLHMDRMPVAYQCFVSYLGSLCLVIEPLLNVLEPFGVYCK
jgi:hypothetical protein